MDASLKFIGHIETPYKTKEECPRNVEPDGPLCRVVVKREFADGLLGLEANRSILLLYWFDKADRNRLRQHSRKTGMYSGVFALRASNRPNPIAAAVVKIEKIEQETLTVRGLDCISGTPLLDIKIAMDADTAKGGLP